MCGRIFEANFALKNRGFGDFGSRSDREEIIENCCERNVRGLGSVGKIYQNIVSKNDPTLPVKGRLYGVEGAAIVKRKLPFSEYDGFKIRHDPYISSCSQSPYSCKIPPNFLRPFPKLYMA
jgi:hypothetical protein